MTHQANEIIQGKRPPSREFHVDGTQIREVRAMENKPQPATEARDE